MYVYMYGRGINYVVEHNHKEWSKQLNKIKQIFKHCHWIDLIEIDLQGYLIKFDNIYISYI